jgi:hypothetical protein
MREPRIQISCARERATNVANLSRGEAFDFFWQASGVKILKNVKNLWASGHA